MDRRERGRWGVAAVLAAAGWLASAAGARAGVVDGLPLRERIDRAIEDGLDGARPAPPATDGEFLRRASLDLAGMIPTADEARAFLDDPSPYKRERLVDRLLDAPEYARRMATAFDVMWMERRPDQHVPSAAWREFLRDAFGRNVPYDDLVRAILEADGSDPARRGPAKFYLDRGADPYAITRDVGRLFLGRDMQCAQCHDHVLVDDYKQAHYHGLFAFFNRTYAEADASGVTALGEKADGDVAFASVFMKKVEHRTGPRLLDGPEAAEPPHKPGEEYWSFPADKRRGIPRHSRRALLAPLLTSGEAPQFHRNAANRLWAMLMGRGLVHPLDLDHAENPPSHPELLDLLAAEFAASGGDIKSFLRELALSETYARSSEPPPGASASVEAPDRFAVAALRPLAPEQVGWSVMQATGIVAAYRADAERRLLTLDPKLAAIVGSDPRRRDLGRRLVEADVAAKLEPSLGPFIQRFGRAAGQAQDGGDATVHQALFLANGQPLQSWLAPNANWLIGRLAAMDRPSAIADELYLAILTRRPTPDERDDVAAYLAGREGDGRVKALQELAWGLLNSAEFRFNH